MGTPAPRAACRKAQHGLDPGACLWAYSGGPGATPLAGVQGAEPPKLMGFSSLKVQENQFQQCSEGKIHTVTPSLSGLSFDHVLTFMVF